MTKPYNTGRVLIGSAYFKDNRPEIHGYMETLQSALLVSGGKYKRTFFQRMASKLWGWV